MFEQECRIIDEQQIQNADTEGMFDVKLNKKIEEKESAMYAEVVYRLKEQQTAEWEGMLKSKR